MLLLLFFPPIATCRNKLLLQLNVEIIYNLSQWPFCPLDALEVTRTSWAVNTFPIAEIWREGVFLLLFLLFIYNRERIISRWHNTTLNKAITQEIIYNWILSFLEIIEGKKKSLEMSLQHSSFYLASSFFCKICKFVSTCEAGYCIIALRHAEMP